MKKTVKLLWQNDQRENQTKLTRKETAFKLFMKSIFS